MSVQGYGFRDEDGSEGGARVIAGRRVDES